MLALALARSRFSPPALAAALIWGGNSTALKVSVSELDPYIIALLQMLIAGVLLLGRVRRSEGRVMLIRRDWPRMLLAGTIGGLNGVLYFFGLSLTTASNAALITSTAPVFALALAVAGGQERLVGRQVAGILWALVGVSLLTQNCGVSLAGNHMLGDLMVLGAAVTLAGYNVLAVSLVRTYSPTRVTAWGFLIGAATMTLLAPWGVQTWDLSRASLWAWFGLGYAAVLASVLAATLWAYALRGIGASRTMIYNYLTPVVAIALAASLLGERLNALQAVGALSVILGLILSSRSAPAAAQEIAS